MLGRYKLANNARVTLHTAINAVATSIVVDAASGVFQNPADPSGDAASGGVGIATLYDSLTTPTKTEIVTYTSLTDNGDGTLTLGGVTRGQEGTSAQSFAAGAIVMQAFTAGQLTHPYVSADQAAGTLALNAPTTVTGSLAQQDGATSGFRALLSAGALKFARYVSGWKDRWQWLISGTESGLNTGSDLSLTSYSDGGSSLVTNVLTVKRSTGNIGIGQAPDNSARLAVAGSIKTGSSDSIIGGDILAGGIRKLGVSDNGARYSLFFQTDANPATVVNVKVTDSGNVVHDVMTYEVATGNVTMGNLFASGIEIGTSPSISAASSSLELTGSGFAAPTVALISHFANAATGNMLAFAKGRGTPATPAIVAENDVLGQITAYGARTSTSYAQMAQISFEADGAITTSSMPGRIVFSVTNSGSLTPTEAMRINRDGSVTFAQGVGVQGPANFAQGVGVQGPANFGGFFSATNDVFLSGSTTISGRFTHGYFVYGQLKLNGVLPTTTVNNQALTAVTQLWRLTGAGGGTWTGLTGGTDGLVVTIVNAGTGNLTLAHENTGSTAGNRFVLPGNASYVVGPNDSVTIYYDGTSARWRVLR